jgi:hypothetical protein
MVALLAAIGPVLLGIGVMVNLLPTLMAGFGVLRGAVVLATTAMKAFTGAMSANWVVVITGALVLATIAMKNWGDSTSDATKKLKNQREETKRLADEQERLNNPLLNQKKADIGEGLDLYGTGKGYADFRNKGMEGGGGDFVYMGDVGEKAKTKIPGNAGQLTPEQIKEAAEKADKALKEAWKNNDAAQNDIAIRIKQNESIVRSLTDKGKEQNIAITTGWDNSKTAFKTGVEGFTSEMAIAKGIIMQNMEALTADMNRILESGLEDTITTLASAFGENLIDGDPFKDLGNVLLSSFGKVMQQMGAAMIAWGISLKLLEENFANPYVAIAAGIGLVAAGAAINKIGQNGLKGANNNPSTGGYSGGSSSSNGGNLVLTTRVDGRDLVMSGNNTGRVVRR